MRQKGFTVVELLIVIVIVAILGTIVVMAVGGIKDRAEDPNWEQSYCHSMRYQSVKDLPVVCLKYYQGAEQAQ